jgi:type I restriction enzyme, S subunit
MKTNFTIANLGDHVRQVSQRNKGESGTEVFSVTNSEGFTRSTDYFSKEVFSKDISNYKVVRKGQFAYNPSRINVGSIDYLRPAEKALVSPLYVVFETDSDLFADYLLRYMKSHWGNAQIRANTEGAVRDSLKYKGLESIKIPLPPLDDQIRIAHLLGKVEGLIAQRKQHLQQLDDLLKSVFLEMFGDPVRNEKEWDKPELKHFGKISTGNTPPRKDPSNYSSRHIEWIKTDNISADSVFISQAAEYLSEFGATKARTVTKGALMVACIAGSVESIGRAALTDRTVAFNQQINAIQPKKDVNPLFLYVSFKISKAYVQSHASKGMKKILTKGDFEKITMIKPSIELQNHYAAIVEKVDTLKSRYQQSLTDLESLYGALSQKAFKGELDLSRVVLPIESEDTESTEELNRETRERHEMEQEFKLPDPIEDWIITEENRHTQIGIWFDAYLDQLVAGEAPSIDVFFELLEKKFYELEGEYAAASVTEYDQVKEWLFKAIAGGRIEQTRNTIQLDNEDALGNQVVLKKV